MSSSLTTTGGFTCEDLILKKIWVIARRFTGATRPKMIRGRAGGEIFCFAGTAGVKRLL